MDQVPSRGSFQHLPLCDSIKTLNKSAESGLGAALLQPLLEVPWLEQPRPVPSARVQLC